MESSAASYDAGDNHYVYTLPRMGAIATRPVGITGRFNIRRNWGFHRKFRHLDGEGK